MTEKNNSLCRKIEIFSVCSLEWNLTSAEAEIVHVNVGISYHKSTVSAFSCPPCPAAARGVLAFIAKTNFPVVGNHV